jgi:hypothetical protein
MLNSPLQEGAMSLELLSLIASSPLPKSFTGQKDIDAVKILRQAGLVIAAMDVPPEGAAKVLAVTEKGRDELLRFHYPDDNVPRRQGSRTEAWIQLAAQRARQVIDALHR